MSNLPEILKGLKREVEGIEAGLRTLVAKYEGERVKMAAEIRTMTKEKVDELKAETNDLVKTCRQWRTGTPL